MRIVRDPRQVAGEDRDDLAVGPQRFLQGAPDPEVRVVVLLARLRRRQQFDRPVQVGASHPVGPGAAPIAHDRPQDHRGEVVLPGVDPHEGDLTRHLLVHGFVVAVLADVPRIDVSDSVRRRPLPAQGRLEPIPDRGDLLRGGPTLDHPAIIARPRFGGPAIFRPYGRPDSANRANDDPAA
jgi:hypothetical protein